MQLTSRSTLVLQKLIFSQPTNKIFLLSFSLLGSFTMVFTTAPNWLNSVHTSLPYFLKIHFNIMLTYMSWSPELSLTLQIVILKLLKQFSALICMLHVLPILLLLSVMAVAWPPSPLAPCFEASSLPVPVDCPVTCCCRWRRTADWCADVPGHSMLVRRTELLAFAVAP
jgi:hypothetical protein